ncbi:MAG TPA: hypothetical protein VFN95_16060, partial [Flavitalea sp.]|nr:hypothetical protein [Flavitalea sp.]
AKEKDCLYLKELPATAGLFLAPPSAPQIPDFSGTVAYLLRNQLGNLANSANGLRPRLLIQTRWPTVSSA